MAIPVTPSNAPSSPIVATNVDERSRWGIGFVGELIGKRGIPEDDAVTPGPVTVAVSKIP